MTGWYFLIVPVWKSVGDGLTREAESGVWVARAGTCRWESPYESRMGYLPWLMSCRLFRLHLRAREEDLTRQLSWIAVRLLVTRAFPVYLVDELVLVFCTPYDWANGGFVDVFCAWYSFSSTGSWCYSNESVWKSKTKLCCIASGVVSSIPNLRVGLCRLVCVEVYGWLS